MSPDTATEISEADKIVDGMNFEELCNEFECISSPSVEATARQLARDILELRQGNRALGTYAVSVKYKVFFLRLCFISECLARCLKALVHTALMVMHLISSDH